MADPPPDEAELVGSLGAARGAFDRLAAPGAGVTAEWRRYSKASPWTLKVVAAKRTLYYLTPGDGEFSVALILGERATVAALADDGVPEPLKQALRDAWPYAEGRGIRVTVRGMDGLAPIDRLVAIKLHPG